MTKMLGEARRLALLQLLKNTNEPITGTDLAKYAHVSRQVVVTDMNILKARNEPILSTSQGYLYMVEQPTNRFERKIVCYHTSEQTKEELYSIVDCGVTVETVIVEHAVYGEITASLRLSNRIEVDTFIQKLAQSKAGHLSALTDGTHLHVISAANEHLLDQAIAKLDSLGILVKE